MPLHKLLHFILPVIIITFFSDRKTHILIISSVLFVLGLIKEVYDWLIFNDPIWMFFWDLGANIIGIVTGIFVNFLWNRNRSTIL